MTDAADYQVILLTGRSDPRHCALSPSQQAFLDLAVPRQHQVPTNFPYDAVTTPYRATPLLAASLRNGTAYFGSRSRSFARRHAGRLIEIVESREHTLILCGSCGLELFNNLHLPASLMARMRLFAFGPVARRRPTCDHLLVGSPKDRLSRWFFPAPDHWVDCTHLDYLQTPALQTLWTEFVRQSITALPACA
jgi:hypothetical protein